MTTAKECVECWTAIGLSRGKCGPITNSGDVFFASDLALGVSDTSSWSGAQATSYSCGSNYVNLFGIAPDPNITATSTLTYTLQHLPAHSGLSFIFNIFKIDQWGASPNETLTVLVEAVSPGLEKNTFNIDLTNAYGGDICGGPGNEMIWTVQAKIRDHTASQLIINVQAPDDGLMVREV